MRSAKAASRARIRRDSGWIEATVSGRLDSALDPDGRRQFTGENRQGYFFVRGSSGSPVFCRGGQQLAAILSLSELGANEGKSPLQEAFAVPATTIRRFRERMAAQPVAAAEGMDATDLRRLLDAIGAAGIPVQEIPARLRAFVEGARAHAAEPPAPTNAGGDIAAAIDTARAKLGDMDLAGARAGLSGKLAEEREARAQRLLPLLREQVAIARLSYAGEDLRQALQEIAGLTPEDAWAWIDLGDACQMAGNTAQALDAYRRARAAAEDAGAERDLSVSHDKIGDVLVAQGEGGAALAAYRAGMAIRERLAAADPGNAEWQRDLSVSHEQDRRRAGGAGRGRGGARGLPGGHGHRRAPGRRRPGQRRMAARDGPGGRGGGGGGARPGGRADRRGGARDRVHLRRHRGEQPRHQGRRALRRGAGQRAAARSSPSPPSTNASSKACATWPPRASSRWCCRSARTGCSTSTLLRAALAEAPTLLVSVMAVNNEIGVVQDLAAIGAIAKAAGALFHTDAAQAAGRVPLDVEEIGADLLSLSGHKMYGPKGIGALYVRRRPRVRLAPLFSGGGQERGPALRHPAGAAGRGLRRGGAAGGGGGAAGCRAASPGSATASWRRCGAAVPGLRVNGHPERRVAGNLNLTFPGGVGRAGADGGGAGGLRLHRLGLLLGRGRALLRAAGASGLPEAEARATLRIGIGRFTSPADVDRAAAASPRPGGAWRPPLPRPGRRGGVADSRCRR